MANELGSIYAEGPYSFKAAEAITQGYAVKRTANRNEVELCDAQGEASLGVALQSVGAGEDVAVLRQGRFDRAIADEALTVNVNVTPAANGKYEPALTADIIVGKAITAAAGADSTFTIELIDAGNASA